MFISDFYEPFLTRYGLTFSMMFVQDLASFILAPILALSIGRAVKGSYRALVLWAGIAVFAAYCFSFYGTDKMYTVLYPAYLAIIDPMVCPQCGGTMKIIAFLTDYAVVDRIINHLSS